MRVLSYSWVALHLGPLDATLLNEAANTPV
jgi:hypothetical protein